MTLPADRVRWRAVRQSGDVPVRIKGKEYCCCCDESLPPGMGYWCDSCKAIRQRTATKYRNRIERVHRTKHPKLAERIARFTARADAGLPLFDEATP